MADESIPWYDPSKSVLPEEVATDFSKFLFLLWNFLKLPEPTAIQYDIGEFLEDFDDTRQLVEAFRGVGKSWITAAFVLWCLGRNWDCRVLVVSASKARADNFSTFVLMVIDSWELLEGLRFRRSTLRTSKVAFDVGPASTDQAPSVMSVGITGQMAGARAWLIVGDDVETPQNSLTQGRRERLNESIKEFDAILKPGGKIVFLGTPQCEDSIYNKIRQRGVTARIWPARVPEKPEVYGQALAPMITEACNEGLIGLPTEVVRFSDKDLTQRELSYGRSGFKLQFMLDTELSDQDKFPLKLEDIPVLPVDLEQAPLRVLHRKDPELALDIESIGMGKDRWYRAYKTSEQEGAYTSRVMAVDPSGRGQDETGIAVGLGLNGQIFIPYCLGVPGGYEESTLELIARTAEKYKVNEIVVESNFGDGMFCQLLKPVLARVYPCTIRETRSSVQKEKRIIDSLEPILNQHRLIVDPQLIRDDLKPRQGVPIESSGQYMLFYQLTRITRDRGCLSHDDRLDTLGLLVSRFLDIMGKDRDKGVQDLEMSEAKRLFTGDHWGIFGKQGGAKRSLGGFSKRVFRR